MLTNIKIGQFIETTTYHHEFRFDDDSGSGYSFRVDADHKPILDNPAAQANWDMCQAGVHADGTVIIDKGIRAATHSYREPTSGTCSCNRRIHLYGDTECVCGRWYNSSGQQLAHPDLWERDSQWDEGYFDD